jgi:hypothetical protein
MELPREDHLATVKQVLRYLAGTRGHGLLYTRREEGQARLVGYSNTDMAGNVDTRESTSGIIFFLARNIVTWQSAKQKVVDLSSCEAEYISAVTAACHGVWFAWLLSDMIVSERASLELRVDNQSTIALSRNPVFHDRSKHVDTRYYFIRECIDGNKIILKYTVDIDRALAGRSSDQGAWAGSFSGAACSDRSSEVGDHAKD